MCPKRLNNIFGDDRPIKRARKVLTLEKKLDVLNRLSRGESATSVARLMDVNESTIRTIKKNEAAIKASVASGTPTSAKFTCMLRDPVMERMEKELHAWIEDQRQMQVPVSNSMIREKALRIYATLGQTSSQSKFQASKGWFYRFHHRYRLNNIKLVGDMDPTDQSAAESYPEQLKKLIQSKGYLPEQVFNADETRLFWKRVPTKQYPSDTERVLPGFKTAKDRVTLLLCANASGDCVVKPMLVYHTLNPRALKGKNKCHLPVFWRANKKASVTGALTMDWLNNCFVHDVERYLSRKNLPFKVLLLLDSGPGHPEALQFAHPNVEIAFLPPNTAPVLQPMNQGIIETFKRYYTRRTFEKILDIMDNNPNLTVADCWKWFTIVDSIIIIKESLDEMKPSTLNICWSNLWKDSVNEASDLPNVLTEIKQIRDVVSRLGDGGMEDVNESDIEQWLQSHEEELVEEDLDNINRCSDDDNVDDEDSDEQSKMTPSNLNKGLLMAYNLSKFLIDIDPIMERSLKFKQNLEELLAPYRQLQKDFQIRMKQTSQL